MISVHGASKFRKCFSYLFLFGRRFFFLIWCRGGGDERFLLCSSICIAWDLIDNKENMEREIWMESRTSGVGDGVAGRKVNSDSWCGYGNNRTEGLQRVIKFGKRVAEESAQTQSAYLLCNERGVKTNAPKARRLDIDFTEKTPKKTWPKTTFDRYYNVNSL